MRPELLLPARMASQLLLEPAESILSAAGHMLAVQSQDFTAGRYALAQRAGIGVTRAQVDELFSSGKLVRSWTMRGTLHICLPQDLKWLMESTKERTLRANAPRLRELEIDANAIEQAAGLVASYLADHGRASRDALFAELNSHGMPTAGQRGIHLLMVLVQHGLICLGPIPADAKLAAQDFVLLERWVTEHQEPENPLHELLLRYLGSHGPATLRDAAWYTGQTLTTMKRTASELGTSLVQVGVDEHGDAYWVVTGSRAEQSLEAPGLLGLPLRLLGGFDEYYLSYANRRPIADEAMQRQIAPGKNGMFLPFWLEQGRAKEVWNAKAAPSDPIGAALHQRYLEFRTIRQPAKD
ncbi:winged helix DNA-binding domain-containing protein [Arthrobacter sp. MYb224]|uniref:winged helix DNA-binding domain-containing protein n=1 Tax=Arthrobacter sp. MYb224 TaxID=1848600 RepID=UPI0015E47903|nr:winged helix DNA-binding domain-containing protein [Arthrobacter sp. MYb224]